MTEEDRLLAAEWALGLLDAPEAAAARARAASDPEFRQLARRWLADLAALAETETTPVAPSAAVEARLQARLFGTEAAAPWWRRLWLVPALLAGALAALVMVWVRPVAPVEPALLATMSAEDRSLIVEAAYDDRAAAWTLTPTAGGAAPGRSLELWLIPEGETPISLGVLDGEGETVLTVPEPLRPTLASATLALSDEPPGGSPGPTASGPVVAIGPVRAP